MTTSVIGALRIVLGIDTAQYEDGLTRAQKQLKSAGRSMEQVGQSMSRVGLGLTATITTAFAAAGFHLLQGSQDAAAAAAQVNAALESMGGASGKTAAELTRSAEALRNLSGVDDDEIMKKVTANMLTFGNIAGDVFDRAQLSVLNLSARMEGDLQGATMMIGKALNDPVKGLAALGRAGIQFTDQQKAQIKAMMGVNNVAGAQAIMLGELEKQFGGAAEAAAKADVWTPMKVALMELEGAFEPIVRGVIAPAIAKVAELTKAFANLSPTMIGIVAVGATIAAALGPALVIIGAVVSAIGTLTAAFATGGLLVGVGAFATAAIPFVAAGAAIAAAIYLLRDDLMPILSAFGKAIMDAVGPAIPPIMAAAREAFGALQNTITALADVVGPILAVLAKAFIAAFGPLVLTALRALAAGIGNAFQIIGAALKVLTALLKGDWSGAWTATGSLIMTVIRGIGRIAEAVFPGITGFVQRMVEGVTTWLSGKLFHVLDGVIGKVKGVSDAFFRLYDAVVGHSYVPDMVTEVGQWMGRLQQAMVDPAERATRTAAEAFEDMRDRARAAMSDLLTDRERLDLAYAQERRDLAGIVDPTQRAEFERRSEQRYRIERNGEDAKGLTIGSIPTLAALSDDRGVKSLNEMWAKMQERIHDSREAFADSFSYGVEAAMRGDWQGLLQSIVGDAFSGALRNAGRLLFDSLGGGKGGGFKFADIGSMFANVFANLPKFANGGTIRAGGAGAIDSQLVAFWKSPSEQVDVYRPANDGGGAVGARMSFDLRGAVMTSDLLNQMQGMAAASGGAAISGARVAVPVDQAKVSRYSRGR